MIPPATQHKLPTPLGIITLVNMSHGYYIHSYAEMQTSSRFCRKNGVCGTSMYSLGKTINLFLRRKRNGKNPLTQTAELAPLLAFLATAQLVRKGKHNETKGTLQQVSFPAPPKHESLLISKDQGLPSCNSQVTVTCTLLLETILLHEKSVDFCCLQLKWLSQQF